MTDAKDYHPASLTNKVVSSMMALREVIGELFILRGNHDYLAEDRAYFEFLNHHRGVHFIVKPYEDMMTNGATTLWLPHTKQPLKDWANIKTTDWFRFVFMHQTAPGSVASNGQKMDGEALPSFKGSKVYSGDIHVPQVIGDIEYVGSPYHVHHGDNFKPRCILLDKHGKAHDLHFTGTPRRLSIKVRNLDELDECIQHNASQGDHVAVTLVLTQENKHQWAEMKRGAQEMIGEWVQINSLKLKVLPSAASLARMTHEQRSDAEIVEDFVKLEGMGADALDFGLDLLQ